MTLEESQRWLHEQIVSDAPHASLGLAIYRNAYRERLGQTLRSMFPVLLHALGGELFDAFARDFIRREPPRGPSLERLAQEFPRYLERTRPPEEWADFIVELATFEAAFRELYDGAGTMSRVFYFTYPVREYFLSVRGGGTPELPQRSAQRAGLTRAGYRVRIV